MKKTEHKKTDDDHEEEEKPKKRVPTKKAVPQDPKKCSKKLVIFFLCSWKSGVVTQFLCVYQADESELSGEDFTKELEDVSADSDEEDSEELKKLKKKAQAPKKLATSKKVKWN